MFAPHALPGVTPGSQYDDGAADGLMVVVQIESVSGVENVEKIAQVKGVDVLFIGERADLIRLPRQQRTSHLDEAIVRDS